MGNKKPALKIGVSSGFFGSNVIGAPVKARFKFAQCERSDKGFSFPSMPHPVSCGPNRTEGAARWQFHLLPYPRVTPGP